MCGIVGFVNERKAAPVVLKSLSKLEYRGYDSAGLATIDRGRLWFKKDAGKLAEGNQKHGLDKLPGSVAIGHVRWATHGSPTAENAHPHLDCRGQIAVVHNGIIDNYQELRSQLEQSHTFVSDTDTEVIPHLIEQHMENGASLEKAVMMATQQLRGSYALVVISAAEPGKMVAIRKNSPLLVGVGDGYTFLASDILSFLEQTNRFIILEDNELVMVNEGGAHFQNGEAKQIEKEIHTADWSSEEASKMGHDFFMLKEILEQPQAIQRSLIQDEKFIIEAAMDILRARQVVITACGSSRYAALIGRYLFSKLARKFCEVVMASEFHYFTDAIDKDTLVIAVSQSGETADVIEGVRKAKAAGAQVISIVNKPGSILARISDKVIYLNCGPEVCVAATKSFVNQSVIFYLLAFAMVNRLEEAVYKLRDVSREIEKSIQGNGSKIEKLSNRTKDWDDFYYIGRGINFAIVSEGALKLKELSYIHAEGMPAGELKHGTLALIEEGTPVVTVCPRDYTFVETLSNAMEAKSRGAFIIGVSDENNEVYHEWIEIPKVEEIFYPLVTVVPLQLLAYHLAISRGNDPDHPRNLAKSVTVK